LFPIALVTLSSLDPFHMTAIRYGITAIILLVLLTAVEGRDALRLEGKVARLALLGSFGFAGLGMFLFVGLQHSRPEHGGIIMATQPLIAAVVAWLLKGTRPARSTLGFLGIALAGVVLVITKGHFAGLFDGGTGWGDLLMFFGAVSWIIYTLGAAEFPSWSPLRYTALTCVLALPTIFGITLAATASGYVATPTGAAVASVGWELAYIIGVASVLGVLSWNAGNKMLGATNGVLFINFVPITVFAIRIAQGHHFTPIEFVGAALVIGALIGNNIATKRPASRVRPRAMHTGGQAEVAGHAQGSRRPGHRATTPRARSAQLQGCG
jgi:drug/metabolite transporter (DMT)-like permease